MSLSASDHAATVTGVAAQLRFDAKNFASWKTLVLAYLESHDLADVVVEPIAPTPEGVRALLEKPKQLDGSVAQEEEQAGAAAAGAAVAGSNGPSASTRSGV